jgi:hypothetical protein
MFLLITIALCLFALYVFLHRAESGNEMNEYCRMEYDECKIPDRSICC